jgi:hypothetical protein
MVDCIPISNAFIERVFSLMENVSTDNRNRLRVEVVKAELCTKVNFNMTCMEFFQKKCVSSQKKYNFKNLSSPNSTHLLFIKY